MPNVQLMPHQQTAVDKLHNGSVLVGGVGTGKTITSLAYFYNKVCKGVIGDYASMRTPKDIYVITTARKRDDLDWESEALLFGIGKHDQDMNPGAVKFSVDSWNNIGKYTDVKDAFFIFDEQRVVGAGVWSKAFVHIAKQNEWVVLSATPGDTWMDYVPIFIANGFVKNRTEFKREFVVYNTYSKYPKIERYERPWVLKKWRDSILVEMPYKRHTKRHPIDVEVDYDEALMRRVMIDRFHVYENRPLQNVSELFSVMRKIVNSDVSRLVKLQELMKKHNRLIVFYNFDYELEALRGLAYDCIDPNSVGCAGHWSEDEGNGEQLVMCPMRTDVTFAEWNGHRHQSIPDTRNWVYLVQYVAGAEGWNCTSTDAEVLYSQTYSYKTHEQVQGRIDRLNTPFTNLYYYMFRSKAPIDVAIKKSLDSKQNFNESRFSGISSDLPRKAA